MSSVKRKQALEGYLKSHGLVLARTSHHPANRQDTVTAKIVHNIHAVLLLRIEAELSGFRRRVQVDQDGISLKLLLGMTYSSHIELGIIAPTGAMQRKEMMQCFAIAGV